MKLLSSVQAKINQKLCEAKAIFKLNVADIHIVDELSSQFKIDSGVQARIIEDIKKNGFSKSSPVHVWFKDGQWVLVDGHTRYGAACAVDGCASIWAQAHSFKDMNEAILFSNAEQFNRRNTLDSELMARFLSLKNMGKTEAEIADDLQKSKRSVSKIAEVVKKSSDEELDAIKKGKTSINKVYSDIKKAEVATAEKQEEEKRVEAEKAIVSEHMPSNEDLETRLDDEENQKTLAKQRLLANKELKLSEREMSLVNEKYEALVLGIKYAYAKFKQGFDLGQALFEPRVKDYKALGNLILSEDEAKFIGNLA